MTSFGSNYYFLYDGLGSVVGIMDATGSVGKSYSYDAFGTTTVSGGSAVNSNLRFASGYHEPAPHNLYQFGTRSYDPTIGRWTQQDPVAGTIEGPSQLDAYLYVGDDPVNYADQSGLCWSGLCWVKHAAHHVRWKKLGAALWETHDTALLIGAGIAMGFGCFATDAVTGFVATAIVAVPCGVAIGTAGFGAYLTGRAAVRDYSEVYR